MIQNVSATKPGFFLDVIRIQNARNGRIAAPVNPAHIDGAPQSDPPFHPLTTI